MNAVAMVVGYLAIFHILCGVAVHVWGMLKHEATLSTGDIIGSLIAGPFGLHVLIANAVKGNI